MFTDKTPALNVTSRHPEAWLDVGRVINVPESEGAVPLGHRFPGLGAVWVIQRSPLGIGVNWGSVRAEARLGRSPCHRRCLGGRRGGRGLVPGSEPPNHEPGLLLLCRDPGCSSINACFFLLLSRPRSDNIRSDSRGWWKKYLLCTRFTEIKSLRGRNAYTSFHPSHVQPHTPQKIHLETTIFAF